MKNLIRSTLLDSADTKRKAAEVLAEDIQKAADMIIEAYRGGHKTLVCGNGGSAADAQHFAAEFVGRFKMERRALPSIALTVDTSALTAIANDYGYDTVFQRQVEALAQPGDVVIGISTSGNSPNVLNAFSAAKKLGARTIGLTGQSGGAMGEACDVCIRVPNPVTARVQETHITILHIWCDVAEKALFASSGRPE